MSTSAVFAASAVSGRLIRVESHEARSSAISPVTSTATRNDSATPRRSATSEASECETTIRAGTSCAESPSTTNGTVRLSTTRVAGSTTEAESPARVTATISSGSGVRRARKLESTAIPPTSVKAWLPSRTESTRASAKRGASAVRARTSAVPPGAADRRRGSAGSDRSYSLRKWPELTIRPVSSWICSNESPASCMASPA